VENADLSKGYQNPKQKLGLTSIFSEIIELKVGRKLPYILCILMLFLELWLLNYLCKMLGYPYFSLWLPITLDKIYFFPIVITFAKIPFG